MYQDKKKKSGKKQTESKMMKSPPTEIANNHGHNGGNQAGHDQGSPLGSRGDNFRERSNRMNDYGSRTSKK